MVVGAVLAGERERTQDARSVYARRCVFAYSTNRDYVPRGKKKKCLTIGRPT